MTIFWTILIVLFILIEGITLSLTALWMAIGAIIALVLAFLEFTNLFQIIVFIFVSIFMLLFVKPIVSNYLTVGLHDDEMNKIIGEKGIVVTDIEKYDNGLVKVKGKTWSAVSIDDKYISKGSEIEVAAIEGAKLIVKKIN